MVLRRYRLSCFFTIRVGCPIGALWFSLEMAAKDKDFSNFVLFPLTLFDSFLVGWFPALLFGALLPYIMDRLGWTKFLEWSLGGGFLAWLLFIAGVQLAKIDRGLFSILLLGVALFKSMFQQTWPAAICGAIVSAVFHLLTRKVVPVITPAASS
jgi:hypothetical protein